VDNSAQNQWRHGVPVTNVKVTGGIVTYLFTVNRQVFDYLLLLNTFYLFISTVLLASYYKMIRPQGMMESSLQHR
jgi:hypothetical protein